MNFKLISNHFGTKVHVWGSYSYTDLSGNTIKEFTPVKKLRELLHTATKVSLICQSFDTPGDDIYCGEFSIKDLFSGTNPA